MTPNKPKHIFCAQRLKAAQFSYPQTETFFGNIERQKCSLLTKEEEKVVLRRRILEQCNLAKHKQKRCFE